MKNILNNIIELVLKVKKYFLKFILKDEIKNEEQTKKEIKFEKISSLDASIHTYKFDITKNYINKKELVEKINCVKKALIANSFVTTEDHIKILAEIENSTRDGKIVSHNIPINCFIYSNNKEGSEKSIDLLYSGIINTLDNYNIESLNALIFNIIIYTRKEIENIVLNEHNKIQDKVLENGNKVLKKNINNE